MRLPNWGGPDILRRMSKLENTFQSLKKSGKKALIPYIMAGDPDLETTLDLLKQLPGAGADVIELGMPFTDPMADGPDIQEAGIRSLQNGTCLKDILKTVAAFRETNTDTPLILMGYFNPVFAYGVEQFCHDAAQAGVNGLLIVDIPPEEGSELWPHAKAAGLDVIRMITPTSKDQRLETVLKGTSGFLYYVSITGITGTASAAPEKVKAHIDDIKSKTDLSVVVGFGIKTPDDAKAMAGISSGVVVGSTLVRELNQSGVDACLQKLRELRKGVDRAA